MNGWNVWPPFRECLKSSSAWVLRESNKGLDRNTVTPASQMPAARSETDPVNFLNWKFNYSQQNPTAPCGQAFIIFLDRYRVISGLIEDLWYEPPALSFGSGDSGTLRSVRWALCWEYYTWWFSSAEVKHCCCYLHDTKISLKCIREIRIFQLYCCDSAAPVLTFEILVIKLWVAFPSIKFVFLPFICSAVYLLNLAAVRLQ